MKRLAHPDSRLRMAHKLNRRAVAAGTGLHTYSSVLRVQYRKHRHEGSRHGAVRAERASTLACTRPCVISGRGARPMLRCDGCAMNTYAAMSRHRLLALTILTRR